MADFDGVTLELAFMGCKDTRGERGVSSTKVVLLGFVCLLVLLGPIIAIEHPPLVDYPNHLARLAILASPGDPYLNDHYKIDWTLLPNLGFDLIGYALIQVTSVYTAGRIFLALVVTLLLSSALALHYALYGRLSAMPLLGGPLIYSFSFQMGFLSFLLGVALAILAFAVWLRCRRLPRMMQFAFLQGMTLILFVCHLFGVGLLAVLAGLSSASTGWRAGGSGLASRFRGAARAILPVVAAFVLPAILLLTTKTGSAGNGLIYVSLETKFFMMPAAIGIDRSMGAVLIAILGLLPLAIARLGGSRVMHQDVVWPVCFLLLIYWPMPNWIFSSALVDWRLLSPAALIAAAAAQCPVQSIRGQWILAVAAIALNAAASANTWSYWRAGDRLASEAISVIERVPRGSVVIPYIQNLKFDDEIRAPSLLHIGTLATIERRALVPTIFALEGQQQISIRDSAFTGHDWSQWMLLDFDASAARAWIERPDNYVLAIRSRGDANFLPGALPFPAELIARTDNYALFRLRGLAE